MKISELREKLKDRKLDELQWLIVEMYKAIPKAVRETKEIDQLVDDPDRFKKKKGSTKQPFQQLNFSTVEQETQTFIKNAYAQNYIAPNRIIPKKERSGWRFTAKRLMDQVVYFSSQPGHEKASIALYEELYKLFCYASGHYVFASEEPFYTLKIPQEDFLKRIILLKKQIEEPGKWIHDSLILILENDLDPQTLTSTLLDALLETLSSVPLKEKMIEIAEILLQERQSKVGHLKDKSMKYQNEDYMNNLVELIFMTKSVLGENKEAIEFFKQNYVRTVGEVELFVLLGLIRKFQNVEDWIGVYEDAIQNNIKPRDGLKTAYKYIKLEGKFPEYIWSV